MEEAKREIMRKRDSVRVKMCERKRGGDTKESKNPRVKGGGGGGWRDGKRKRYYLWFDQTNLQTNKKNLLSVALHSKIHTTHIY